MLQLLLIAPIWCSWLPLVTPADFQPLEDQCDYYEIPNFRLKKVDLPARTLFTFVANKNITNRFDCFSKCCSDEFQIAANGRCSAAAYYMNTASEIVCELLECEYNGDDLCSWSPGSTGRFAGFIRSTKTTTTTTTTTTASPPTTTTLPTTTTQVGLENEEEIDWFDDMGNEETPVYNGTDIQGMDNTDKTTGTKGQEETKTEEEATKPPEHKTGSDGNRPDMIEPTRDRHEVSTRGLAVGIVVAILLVLCLVSFLVKQLKGSRTDKLYEHSKYRPLYEEEYQKLTSAEET